jgi:integral membrane sensor domain MASE1
MTESLKNQFAVLLAGALAVGPLLAASAGLIALLSAGVF